jgi:hypothetical protein
MSDDGTMATGAGGITGDTAPRLHETSGAQLRSDRPAASQADALAEFVKQQPVTVALAALIIGYLLGKIT